MNRQSLIEKYGDPDIILNSKVVDIFKDAGKHPTVAAEWVKEWAGWPDIITKSLGMKLERLFRKVQKLRREARQCALDEVFIFPVLMEHQSGQEANPQPTPPPLPLSVQGATAPLNQVSLAPTVRSKSPQKKINLMKYQIQREEAKLKMITKKVNACKMKLTELKRRRGHYYTERNVKKREARNTKIKMALREEKNEYKIKALRQENEIACYRERVTVMEDEMAQMRRSISHFEEEVGKQQKEIQELREKKRKAEKRASFHFRGKSLLVGKLKEMEESIAMEDEERKIMEGGRYTENIRLCVLELTSLEVATSKIAEVINCVSQHVFRKNFSQLPSRQACQNMIDEGQVIVKAAIGEKLRESEGWGIHKDGTTRKTVKILDTSIRMNDGTAVSLGFSAVTSETAEAIADEAKEKIEEVEKAVDEEGLRRDLMQKLAYFMNDRAANEKKSSRLLEEWRDKMLIDLGQEKTSDVHHLFCTAHVLLGFQSYAIKSLHEFNTTGQFRHPILTLLRDAADLFGPVGDYRGCRSVWEAFCQDRKIKSLIQNFKDNRFNGLFEVSAQVFFHHQEFCFILQSKEMNNAKQSRLLKALQTPDLILVLECLGLFFFKITGPFWSLAISPTVTPSDLPAIVQDLQTDLNKTKRTPSFLFEDNSFSCLASFQIRSSNEAQQKLCKEIKSPLMATVIVSLSNALLDTIQAQMSDFLPSGKYGELSAGQLSNVSFAPINNLLCERNFGVLDASQRRRPNASLHHHSSVVMLKQNRGLIKKFCASLSASKKKLMWAKATAMGKTLRLQHRAQDRRVLFGSLEKTLKKPKAKTRQKRTRPASPPTPREVLPVKQGDLVAVACEDHWYPAIVLDDSSQDEITVDFAELSTGLGCFKWPNGRDVHQVSRRSVLATGLDIEPRGGGRSWLVTNAKEIQSKFQK